MSALALAALALLGTGRAAAQYYPPPEVSCYYSPPVVYAPAPVVSYYAPAVSYYAPAVSYYAPAVSYYAPAVSYYGGPGAVTTTRYGLFGRPRYSTTYYYP
jgi:hypothetical protein